jgi:predicted HAD superfamily Cof-like phosphohydrolase
LIRIAKQKYIDQGKEKNLSSAVKALLDLIEFKYGTVDKWQGVRKDHFWTLEVNDILHANIDGL